MDITPSPLCRISKLCEGILPLAGALVGFVALAAVAVLAL
jgi:hypothetical protein